MANRAAQIRAENAGLAVTDRGRNHIEFDAGNGRRRQVVTIDPLHIAGTETEIDTAWQPATGAWQHEMTLADFQAHARSVFNAGGLLEFRIGEEWVIFDPQSINWTNQDNSRQQIAIKQTVTGIVEDDVLRFPAGYGAGRHFQYQNQSRRLQKLITIDSPANLPAPTVTGTVWFEAEFTISTSAGIDFYLDGVRWAKVNNIRVKTANRIEIRDAATGTNVLWLVEAPRAWDSADNQTIGEFEVRRQGGASNLFITVRIPKTWIDTAVFPIFVDPTLTLQPDATAGQDTQIYAGGVNNNYGVAAEMITGVIGAASTIRGLIKFDLSSIPAAATIDSALMTLYCYFEQNTTDRDVSAHRSLVQWFEGQKNGATPDASQDGSTWNNRNHNGTVAWSGGAGGGSGSDFVATATATVSITAASTAFDWDVAADVQDYVDSVATNHGWWMIGTEGTASTNKHFRSSDYTTAGERPELVVEYTEAAGGASPLLSILMQHGQYAGGTI